MLAKRFWPAHVIQASAESAKSWSEIQMWGDYRLWPKYVIRSSAESAKSPTSTRGVDSRASVLVCACACERSLQNDWGLSTTKHVTEVAGIQRRFQPISAKGGVSARGASTIRVRNETEAPSVHSSPFSISCKQSPTNSRLTLFNAACLCGWLSFCRL